MGYEIDFLALQSTGKSGDAICMRFGALSGLLQQQQIVVIDAGHQSDGPAVVDHIRTFYRNPFVQGDPTVDLLVCTHPDGDHIGGILHVLQTLPVRELWIHKPWAHAAAIQEYIDDRRFSAAGTRSRLQRDLDSAYQVVQTATRMGVTVREPFQGVAGLGGAVRVLGPTLSFYQEQLALFRLGGMALPALPNPGIGIEDYATETLDVGGGTSPMNETSAVLWFQLPEGDRILLTGDAGVLSLSHAIIYAMDSGIDVTSAGTVQIPHHGSRRNVSPVVLDAMLGRAPGLNHSPFRHAIASCAPNGGPKHPSDRVLNAFTRRGCATMVTAGSSKWIYRNVPSRASYYAATGVPLKAIVGG